ncbi:cardiolipin synthase [Sphingomonas daechungensis]|uniref:cardiolipin synthase n=1 Tax=Sphingomonas daechungensis TaxID=1176646 RepID=UPI0037832388
MQPFYIIAAGLLVSVAQIAVVIRAILRPHRDPSSRLAWAVVIVVAPIIGMVAYLLLGEVRISLGRRDKGRAIEAALPRPAGEDDAVREVAKGFYRAPFDLGESVNGLETTSGNSATLAADSNVAIEEMVRDIDAAVQTVHLLAYIWLADHNGTKVKDALIRAAKRGVKVRALADALGSRHFIRSSNWSDLADGGVEARVALPVGNPLWTILRGRVDLRNHRKMLIIDNRIAWCGSQNVADPEFRVKPHYAPWVDIMTRWQGQVVHHCQYLFVSDWMGDGGDDISALLSAPVEHPTGTIIAQVVGTGPTVRYDAMPSCFAELIHSAREELVVTTPYFVPDDQVLSSLLSAARRGVKVIFILPKRNDSRVVQATSRSYYADLIKAGVKLYEYRCGLLHAKTMVADRKIGLIGSANLDRRSFELNFENNILFSDEKFAGVIRARQDEFLAQSDPVTMADVESFSLPARFWQNSVAMLSPIF